jgi:gas vesicle protein
MANKQTPLDSKTELTFKTIENLRISSKLFQEFAQAANNYAEKSKKLSEAGKQLAETLQKISQLHNGDLGEGILKLSDVHRASEFKRENLSKIMIEELIPTIQRNLKPEDAKLSKFESDYKKSRADIRQQIAKLESNSKKAGKKGPEALKQAISALNEKIKEAEQIKADKLREVLLLERSKYCNFLSSWSSTINGQIELNSETSRFKEYDSQWRTLASSNSNLPQELEHLITAKQERTFVQIQSGETSYADSYSSTYDTYDSNSNYTLDYSANTSSSYIGTATALYDFAGEQPEDLPFYAGDIINITQEDDGSGWLTGELNGISGIFPASYVERNY